MIIAAKPGVGRNIDYPDFAAITSVEVVDIRWNQDGLLEVEFASDLTPAEAIEVKQFILSRNANELVLRMQALTALQNNRDFIAVAAPTNAQTIAQVKALSRQNVGVIRMLLGELDGTN